MQDKLGNTYIRGCKLIESYQSNFNATPDCQIGLNSENISFHSIYDTNLPASLLPCKQFQISQYYNNFALINAFNVLQSQIQLMRNIYERTENPFAVWLCDQGEWKIIMVNDLVPCIINNTNNKIESAFKCNYQWPIIIEKAIATLLGDSYDLFNCLVTTSIQSFIYLLIGQPIEKIQFNTIEELQALLKQKNSIFFIEVYYKMRYNAYVIKSVQFQNQDNYVELQAINKESICDEGIPKQDSIFLLSWNKIQISSIYQVHLNHGYQTYTFTMKQPIEKKIQFIEHTYIYTFEINNTQKNDAPYWISICQRDQNMNSSQKQKEIKYGLIRLFLFMHIKKRYKFISEGIGFNQNLYFKTELQQGKYTLICQAEFFNLESLPKELQSKQQILKFQIQGIQAPQRFDQTNQNEQTLRELIITMIRQKSTNENTYEYKEEGFPQVQRTLGQTNGILYIYYENHGESNFEEFLQFNKHRNLISHETQEMQKNIKVSIPPKEYMLYVYKFDPRVLLDSDSISFDYSLNIKGRQSDIIPQSSEVIPQPSQIIAYPQQLNIFPKQSQINPKQSNIIPKQPNLIQVQSEIHQRQTLFDYIYSQKNLQCKDIENPEIFIKQHENGVVLLFVNQSTKSIQVQCELTLQNLSIQLNSHINLIGKIGTFLVLPNKYQFILLDRLHEQVKNYNYKMKVDVENLN